jgi:D-lactate dehydrogenase
MPAGVAALLVEFRAADADAHRRNRQAGAAVRDKLTLVAPVASITNRFTEDTGTINMYWHARQAFMTAVGKARPTGTTLITEDFAVLPSQLADACVALSELQRKHGFDAAAAGHAAHGNLHFLLAFDAPPRTSRAHGVHGGLLRHDSPPIRRLAEGRAFTGRNMTPFLELEWGPVPPGDVAGQAAPRSR